MSQELKIQLFENAKIRVVWDDEKEEYFFSVVDVVGALTESADGRKYWNKLKQRLVEEGNETVTNCHQLKLPAADGKMRLTDVAMKINSADFDETNREYGNCVFRNATNRLIGNETNRKKKKSLYVK